jgi:hypothetical protein
MKTIFFSLFSLFISLSVFAQPKCEEIQFSKADQSQIQTPEPLKIVFQLLYILVIKIQMIINVKEKIMVENKINN